MKGSGIPGSGTEVLVQVFKPKSAKAKTESEEGFADVDLRNFHFCKISINMVISQVERSSTACQGSQAAAGTAGLVSLGTLEADMNSHPFVITVRYLTFYTSSVADVSFHTVFPECRRSHTMT